MGHDATMQMYGQSGGGSIHGFAVTADELSTQYKERLENWSYQSKLSYSYLLAWLKRYRWGYLSYIKVFC